METIVLIVHLLIAMAMVGIILLQRSEGGALGIGGGGGGGGFMSSRGTANVLTRTTSILAAAFFVTSISLTLLAKQGAQPQGVIDSGLESSTPAATPAPAEPAEPAPPISQ